MTYYYLNENGLLQRKVGGDPPAATFVAVSPDGIMRKFSDGVVKAVVPGDAMSDGIEYKNAAALLGVTKFARGKKKSKSKSKRKTKCRCK